MIELSARSFFEISEVEPKAMAELSEKNFLIAMLQSIATAHG